jgi:hypothetical protein
LILTTSESYVWRSKNKKCVLIRNSWKLALTCYHNGLVPNAAAVSPGTGRVGEISQITNEIPSVYNRRLTMSLSLLHHAHASPTAHNKQILSQSNNSSSCLLSNYPLRKESQITTLSKTGYKFHDIKYLGIIKKSAQRRTWSWRACEPSEYGVLRHYHWIAAEGCHLVGSFRYSPPLRLGSLSWESLTKPYVRQLISYGFVSIAFLWLKGVWFCRPKGSHMHLLATRLMHN